jgi:citrate synthase
LLINQADHDQNTSTSAMRFVGSTRANPYARTAAAIRVFSEVAKW